ACTIVDAVTLTTIPEITDVTFVEGTPLDCDNPIGTVQVTVVGGWGDFSIENLTTGQILQATGPVFMAEFDITEPGSYTVEVTDNITQCTFLSDPYEVAEFDIISATAVETVPVVCIDGTEGTIEVTINDYTGNYYYEVLDINGNPLPVPITGGLIDASFTNPLSITGLSAGSYIVAIEADDAPGCDTVTNVVT